MTRLLFAPFLLAASMAAGCAAPVGTSAATPATTTDARSTAAARDEPLPTVRLAQVPGWPAELANANSGGGWSPAMALGECLSMMNRPPFGGSTYIFGAVVTNDGVQFHGARNNPMMPRRVERIWCTYSAALAQASLAPADVEDAGPGDPPFVALRREDLPEPTNRVATLGDLGLNGLVIAWSE